MSFEKCVTLDYNDNDIIFSAKEEIVNVLCHGLL